MLLGQSYMETAQYSKAIEVLNDLIQKDPTNQEAYFHRAAAYFETGNFDDALTDFLESNHSNQITQSSSQASNEFTQALLIHLQKGASESVRDFVPSLCSSAHGLNATLWALNWSTNPFNPKVLDNMKNFANASYEVGTCIVNYCKNVDVETFDSYVDQIKFLYQQYDQLNDVQKGELIGYTIGRYGVDILSGAVATEGMQYVNTIVPLFRNLRNANRICNFSAMCQSEAEKKAIIASSLVHETEREIYLKRIKIHWDKQNKHIPNEHNFLQGRGTILIEKSELEVLTRKYIGTGQRVDGSFGDGGFVERVDFKKIIGEYAIKVNGKVTYIPTSKGIIKHAKDGTVHIIPSNPEAIIK